MNLITEPYLKQLMQWPSSGRHILAQFDEESIVVYQAYKPTIGHFTANNGYFGGDFSLSRMSWIKPGFLWMMHRSQWSSLLSQEVVLAIRIRLSAFDGILAQAVHSTYIEELYGSTDEWKQALAASSVRLQWDPDHDPKGNKLERRAVQIGLRGEVLARYSREWIMDIEDISAFAHQQYQHVRANDYASLMTPLEKVYPVNNAQIAARLGISIA